MSRAGDKIEFAFTHQLQASRDRKNMLERQIQSLALEKTELKCRDCGKIRIANEIWYGDFH